MKRLVIINDCAYVMENLIPVLTSSYEVKFIKRTRSPFSKTIGIAWKIMAVDGDIFHVNYGLQDAYFVDKFKGHLDILHLHGSDVRTTLRTWRLGWMVRSNIKRAKKVLYATEDMENEVLQIRPDAIYLPTPINTAMFSFRAHLPKKIHALYFRLSYEALPPDLPALLDKNGIDLKIYNKTIPYKDMPKFLMGYDIFIDRFSIASLSKTALEAMSEGLATIDYRDRNALKERVEFLSNSENVRLEGERNREFILQRHDYLKVGKKLLEVYDEL